MCTAITYQTKDHYFGRNLDLNVSYGETVTIMPRNFPFPFRKVQDVEMKYAMIGMAVVIKAYPLFFDATNEKGLSMAGLNFPGNADYKPERADKDNVTPFEFIPWILGQCADVAEAKSLLEHCSLLNEDFSREFPLSPLHWIISDRETSITVESVKDGLKVYANPVGVLTNNPPFDFHMTNLNHYMNLTREEPVNQFAQGLKLEPYGRGMGCMGMPGDWSPASRFVKAVFTKMNSVAGDSESESVGQFFHILGAVEHPRGCIREGEGQYSITVYSSCCNVDKGIYYYTTYDNRQITGVDMKKEDLTGRELISYPLVKEQQIRIQNQAG